MGEFSKAKVIFGDLDLVFPLVNKNLKNRYGCANVFNMT